MKYSTGGDNFSFSTPSTDPQFAIIYGIAVIGSHLVKKYKSDEKELKKQVVFLFELEDTMTIKEEERPMTQIETYTLSFDTRAKLRIMLHNFLGNKYFEVNDAVDFEDILGSIGVITIENKKVGEKTYSNLVSFTRPMKNAQLPDTMFNTKFLFDINDEKPDWDQFILMPYWIAKKVVASPEFKALLKAKKIPQMVYDHMMEEEKKRADKDAKKNDKDSNSDRKPARNAPVEETEVEEDEYPEGWPKGDDDPFANRPKL